MDQRRESARIPVPISGGEGDTVLEGVGGVSGKDERDGRRVARKGAPRLQCAMAEGIRERRSPCGRTGGNLLNQSWIISRRAFDGFPWFSFLFVLPCVSRTLAGSVFHAILPVLVVPARSAGFSRDRCWMKSGPAFAHPAAPSPPCDYCSARMLLLTFAARSDVTSLMLCASAACLIVWRSTSSSVAPRTTC